MKGITFMGPCNLKSGHFMDLIKMIPQNVPIYVAGFLQVLFGSFFIHKFINFIVLSKYLVI